MLHLLLLVAMVTAPLLTGRFLLVPSRIHDGLHGFAVLITAASLVFELPVLSASWMLFCLFSLAVFIKQNPRPRSLPALAQAVPFVFGIVGALWFVAGTNHLKLLGYGTAFSYYAALHSHVLGWILIGAIAVLAARADRFNIVFAGCVFAALGSFFLIAFGINGSPLMKLIGVVGLTLVLTTAQVLFLIECKGRPLAGAFATLSLIVSGLTLTLAWKHELTRLPTMGLLGVRSMVSVHGVLNGFVLAPCTILALHFRFRPNRNRAPERAR